MIRPGEVVIHDGNYQQFLSATVDGEQKGFGLIPRDYSTHPVGFYASAPPYTAVDMPLIPESEWSERIRDKVASKSQLSDIRLVGDGGQPIKSRDQNGRGYCATEDTEILTSAGWVPYPEYDFVTPAGTINPLTHALEFQRPFARHVYEYDGPMIYSTNRRLDFGVTPDHQMYVRKWDESKRTLSERYSFVRAADLGWYCGLMAAPHQQIGTEFVEIEIPGDRKYRGDDFLALLGLIVSDGYAGGSDNTRNWVSFASFREGTRSEVATLAERCGFRETPSRRGVFVRYDAACLARWLRENAYVGGKTGARAKRVPDLVKVASSRQINHFLHWFDDRSRDSAQFYSASKRLIDDLQELHLRIGKRSSIGTARAKDVPFAGSKSGVIHSRGGYVLTVSQTDQLCIDRKKHIETERYRGRVYCASVPNHTLVTRRNGSVLISSNCWAHSGVSALILQRAAANMPYADLSAYAVACIIKNYRDEGGWGAAGLDFLMARGCPTAKFWPQQSVSRSNDNPETWANAALYRVSEGWIDLQAAAYDRNLSRAQVATCLLTNTPVIGDHNWWGHSIAHMDLVDGASTWGQIRADGTGKLLTLAEFEAYWSLDVGDGFGTRIWNSWGDGWSDRGMGVLSPSKAWPDGATAIRASRASAA